MSSLFAFIRQDLRAALIASLLVLSHALLLTATKARKSSLSRLSKLMSSTRSTYRQSHPVIRHNVSFDLRNNPLGRFYDTRSCRWDLDFVEVQEISVWT